MQRRVRMSAAAFREHHADYPGINLMQAGGNILSLLATSLGEIEIQDDASLGDIALALALESRLSAYAESYFNRRLTY